MKIFITIDAYLPGFRFGGPIRSIANFVEWFGEEHQIYIFTKDRDLNERRSYSGVVTNEWVSFGNAKVFYADPQKHTCAFATEEIEKIQPDVVYLNGLWERMSRGLLLNRYRSAKYILAPRGALMPGALKHKRLKKAIGMMLVKSRLRGLVWHAAGMEEEAQVRKLIDSSAEIHNVSNLLARRMCTYPLDVILEREPGCVRIVAFSRVSQTKNFEHLLGCLRHVKAPVRLDIIGPKEDPEYFERLKQLASSLGSQHEVGFLGEMSPEDLRLRLPKYDVFCLPTKNENFGHVFVEAWAAGLPVIISDQTPWRGLEELGVGWDLALQDTAKWIGVLEQCARMSWPDLRKLKVNAVDYACTLALKQPKEKYQEMISG